MRKYLGGFVAAVAVAATSAGGADADAGGVDLFAGSWQRVSRAGFDLHTHVDAQSDALGANARGHFWSETMFPSGTTTIFRARAMCLRVFGNRAIVGGIVEESTSADVPVGSAALIQATDNGSPGDQGDTTINLIQADPAEALTCPFFEFPEVPILQGNILIRDATS